MNGGADMKRIILCAAALLSAASLCACGSKAEQKKEIPQIEPTELVTIDDVTAYAGYIPVISETTRDGNRSSVLYVSDPLGQYDPVEVKLIQFNDEMGYQQIFDYYEQQKSMRQDAELLESLGQETYIAYPTIHVYDRGCLIEITAGSGAGDEQRQLLRQLASNAAARLEEIVPEYKPEG